MSWINELVNGIIAGIVCGGNQTIAVHTEAQKELGLIAVSRILNKENPRNIEFKVVPTHIPLGKIITESSRQEIE